MWRIRKEKCTWTKLWSWFGGAWGGFKRKKCQKKKLKNYVFPFRMIMRKFRTVIRNGPEGICVANQREISKLILYNHAKILHSHVKCSRKAKIGIDAFFTSHNHAKLLDLVRNDHFITKLQISWWKSLWKTS